MSFPPSSIVSAYSTKNNQSFEVLKQTNNHTVMFDNQNSNENSINCFVKFPFKTSNPNEENEWSNISRLLLSAKDLLKNQPNYNILEEVIHKVGRIHNQNLNNLECFFRYEPNSQYYLKEVIPKVIDLALELPDLIKKSIPILQQEKTHSVSFNQKQCASILANAFFCTLPSSSRFDREDKMPMFNFDGWFVGSGKGRPDQVKIAKIKCILHYFDRITKKNDYSIITYSRYHVKNLDYKIFANSDKKIRKPIIKMEGTIEDCKNAIQVDFANMYIGGGVLSTGCVQEEIRFCICPELIVSMLFMERMDNNECIFIRGAERFSNYKGYAWSFEWLSDFEDKTERDKYGRLLTDIVAIDALCFGHKSDQYKENLVWREIKKAFIGFSSSNNIEIIDPKFKNVATGNWGCGAFNGSIDLKFLIQLAAAGEAEQEITYFTFNDSKTADMLNSIADLLIQNNKTVGYVFNLLINYCQTDHRNSSYDLLKYLKHHCGSKI